MNFSLYFPDMLKYNDARVKRPFSNKPPEVLYRKNIPVVADRTSAFRQSCAKYRELRLQGSEPESGLSVQDRGV